jgi:hypothetical protein
MRSTEHSRHPYRRQPQTAAIIHALAAEARLVAYAVTLRAARARRMLPPKVALRLSRSRRVSPRALARTSTPRIER